MVRRCFHCFLKILQVMVATILSIGSHTKKALRLWNWGRTTPPKKQHVPQGVTGQPGSKALLSWAAAKNKAWCLHTQNALGCHSNSPQHHFLFLFAAATQALLLCYDLNVPGNRNGLLHSCYFSANCPIFLPCVYQCAVILHLSVWNSTLPQMHQ